MFWIIRRESARSFRSRRLGVIRLPPLRPPNLTVRSCTVAARAPTAQPHDTLRQSTRQTVLTPRQPRLSRSLFFLTFLTFRFYLFLFLSLGLGVSWLSSEKRLFDAAARIREPRSLGRLWRFVNKTFEKFMRRRVDNCEGIGRNLWHGRCGMIVGVTLVEPNFPSERLRGRCRCTVVTMKL